MKIGINLGQLKMHRKSTAFFLHMQIKDKKIREFLHISKKSCKFAPKFVIKSIRPMKQTRMYVLAALLFAGMTMYAQAVQEEPTTPAEESTAVVAEEPATVATEEPVVAAEEPVVGEAIVETANEAEVVAQEAAVAVEEAEVANEEEAAAAALAAEEMAIRAAQEAAEKQAEQERWAAEQERLAAEKEEIERLKQERLAAEQAENERVAAEREQLAAEKAELERLKQERIERERAELEQLREEKRQEEARAAAQETIAPKAQKERSVAAAAPREPLLQRFYNRNGRTSLSILSVGYSTYFMVGQAEGVSSTRDAFRRHILDLEILEFRAGIFGMQLLNFEMGINTPSATLPMFERGGSTPETRIEATAKTMWFAYKPALKFYIPCTKWMAVELFGGAEVDLTKLWSKVYKDYYKDTPEAPEDNFFVNAYGGLGVMFLGVPQIPVEIKAEYRHPLKGNHALVPQGIYLTFQVHLAAPFHRNR